MQARNHAIRNCVVQCIGVFRLIKPDGQPLDGISERQFVKSMCRVKYKILDENAIEAEYDLLIGSKSYAIDQAIPRTLLA